MNYLISFPRSGRAWTLTICAKLEDKIGKFQHKHSHDGATDRTIRRYDSDKSRWANHNIALTLRDPRDVVVSYWHLLKYRWDMPHTRGTNIFEWTKSQYGVPYVVKFLNDWQRAINRGIVKNVTVLTYESWQRDFERQLYKLANAFNIKEPNDSVVQYVRSETTIEKIRNRFRHSNEEPDNRCHSARRGEIGVWREYYTRFQQRWIDDYIDKRLKGFRDLYAK